MSAQMSVDHQIGLLRGQMESVAKDLNEAKQSRKETAKALEEVNRGQALILQKVENIEDRLKGVETTGGEFKAWRERIKGALWLATSAGGAIGAALTYMWSKISN